MKTGWKNKNKNYILNFYEKFKRVFNEHESDIKRTQIYALAAVYYGGLLSFARLYVSTFWSIKNLLINLIFNF